jgi:WD40 repeat protein
MHNSYTADPDCLSTILCTCLSTYLPAFHLYTDSLHYYMIAFLCSLYLSLLASQLIDDDSVCTNSSTLDKTCKLWSAETGQLYHTYRGHATEIVCLSFNPHGTMIATGSMDNTARLWDVESGECLHTLLGHTAEIVSLDFDTQGQRIVTGSFDNTVKVWDVRNGRCIHTLTGHQGEISSCQFNFASDLCISGSIDRTCKVS